MNIKEDINILVDELEMRNISEEEFRKLLDAVLSEYLEVKYKETKYELRDYKKR
jgi:hypothetical protein